MKISTLDIRHYITERDNFSIEYSEISKDTKAGEILSIIDSIYEILKEYEIDIDDSDEYDKDYDEDE